MSPSSTGGAAPGPAAAKTRPSLPAGELELATLALAAADAWDDSPLPALLWCSKAQLRTGGTAFKASVGTAGLAGDALSPAAARLAELDREIDNSLQYVKNYLKEAHEDKAKSHYPAFGINRQKGGWKLRSARPARVEDLTKLVAALKTSDYDKSKFGTAFWAGILKEYAPLAELSGSARGTDSVEASAKNVLEAPLRKQLRALRQHIKTNFPATSAAELRRFGYLQESF